MANKITVLIDVLADKARNSIKGFRKELDGAAASTKSMAKSSSGSFDFVKGNAGKMAAGAGVALLAFADDILHAGVQLEALKAKAKVVFGESLGVVQDWADANAAAMGLTADAAVGAGAAIGDLLIPMGFSRDVAADMSTKLLDLGGALSAWSGGTVSATEVTQIFTKAMLGERDGLKALGISITEAEVSSVLASKGQAQLTGATLAQAKALAVQELIYAKSTDAQKAWADGSMDGVKSQNEATAAFAQLGEVMNESLYPVLVKLVPAVTALAEAAVPLIGVVAEGAEVVTNMSGAVDQMDDSFGKLEPRLKAAGFNANRVFMELQEGRTTIAEVTKELQKKEQQLAGTSDELNAYGKYVAALSEREKELAAAEEDATAANKAAAEQYRRTAGELRAQRDAVDKLTQSNEDLYASQLDLIGQAHDLERAQDDAQQSIDDYNTTVEEYGAASEEASDAARDTADELYELAGAQSEAKNGSLNSKEAIDDQIIALELMKQSVEPGSPLWLALEAYIDQLRRVAIAVANIGAGNIDRITGERYTIGGGTSRTSVQGAAGGIVTRPTVALIGEAGPEAVVPLNRTPGSSPLVGFGGGSPITVNVYPRTMPSDTELIDLINKIRRRGGQI